VASSTVISGALGFSRQGVGVHQLQQERVAAGAIDHDLQGVPDATAGCRDGFAEGALHGGGELAQLHDLVVVDLVEGDQDSGAGSASRSVSISTSLRRPAWMMWASIVS